MKSIIKGILALALALPMATHAVDFDERTLMNYLNDTLTKEALTKGLIEEPEKFELNFTVLLQSVPADLTQDEKAKIVQLEDEINKQLIEYNSNREPDFKIKMGGAVIGAVVAYTAVYRGMGAHTIRGDLTTYAGKALVAVIGLGVGAAAGGVIYVTIDQLLEKPHILPSTTRLLKYIE